MRTNKQNRVYNGVKDPLDVPQFLLIVLRHDMKCAHSIYHSYDEAVERGIALGESFDVWEC